METRRSIIMCDSFVPDQWTAPVAVHHWQPVGWTPKETLNEHIVQGDYAKTCIFHPTGLCCLVTYQTVSEYLGVLVLRTVPHVGNQTRRSTALFSVKKKRENPAPVPICAERHRRKHLRAWSLCVPFWFDILGLRLVAFSERPSGTEWREVCIFLCPNSAVSKQDRFSFAFNVSASAPLKSHSWVTEGTFCTTMPAFSAL